MEHDLPVRGGEKGVIPAAAYVVARVETGAPLTDNDAAGAHGLAAEAFDTEAFGFRVAAVAGTATCFFVSHENLRCLTRNASNLDFGIILAVPLALHVVLAPPELDDVDFLVPSVGLDRCGNLASRNEWLTDLDPGIGLDKQNLVELNLLTGLCDKSLDLQGLAFLDPVLLAARLDYRIHVEKLREAKFLLELRIFYRSMAHVKWGWRRGLLSKSTLAFCSDLIYKRPVLLSTPKQVEAYF